MKKGVAVLVLGVALAWMMPARGQLEAAPKTTGRVTTVLAADGTNLTAQVENAIAAANKLYSQTAPISDNDLRRFIGDTEQALSALLFINTAADIKKTTIQTKELSVRATK